jgi:nitroreductase
MSKTQFDVLAEIMRSRHSVKKYEPGVVIPREELEEMLALTSTAPSSWNLQHWRYIVITSQEMKERILPIAYNQSQVADSSATIVILGDLEANRAAHDVYGQSLKDGFITQKVHDTLISQIEGAYQRDPQIGRDEAILNASLAAMQLMLIAKAKGYDTCPMGGFNDEALIKELEIPSRYIPVMLIVIGKAATPGRPTERFSLDTSIVSFTR